MSKILYAWELGGGYGHIAAFLPVAQQLKQDGHDVAFALKNLEYADAFLGSNGFSYLQAPIRWPDSQPMQPALSYPGILQNTGFGEASGLASRLHAWRMLYRHATPDLLVFDHAPTALLAAQGLGIPRALFGTGFYSPPRLTPLPAMRAWQPVAEKALIGLESQVLAVINSVLPRFGAQPLAVVAELFDAEENFLCTLPELDHYRQRCETRYWGPSLQQDHGAEPQWPATGTKRIFAYLKHDFPGLEALLQQLRASSWSSLIHIPGTTPAFIQKHSAANLLISPHPLKLADAGKQCDLAICHGGAGTLAALLLLGKPLLLLPLQLEQLISARNVAALGAGICVAAEAAKPNYRAMIMELLSQRKYVQAAEHFANKYADFSAERQVSEIADRCSALMRRE